MSLGLGLLLVFLGFLSITLGMKHLLVILLGLEVLVISLFYMISSSMELNHIFFGLLYLVMGVCEGILGLGTLIYMGRSMGFESCKVSLII